MKVPPAPTIRTVVSTGRWQRQTFGDTERWLSWSVDVAADERWRFIFDRRLGLRVDVGRLVGCVMAEFVTVRTSAAVFGLQFSACVPSPDGADLAWLDGGAS